MARFLVKGGNAVYAAYFDDGDKGAQAPALQRAKEFAAKVRALHSDVEIWQLVQ